MAIGKTRFHPERVGDDLPRAVEAVRRAGLQAPMMTTAITDPADPRTEPILQTGGALGIRYYRLGYLDYPDGRSLPDVGSHVDRLDALQDQAAGVAPLEKLSGSTLAFKRIGSNHTYSSGRSRVILPSA